MIIKNRGKIVSKKEYETPLMEVLDFALQGMPLCLVGSLEGGSVEACADDDPDCEDQFFMNHKKAYKKPQMKICKICAKAVLVQTSGGDVIIEQMSNLG